jgi:hypothetical protein
MKKLMMALMMTLSIGLMASTSSQISGIKSGSNNLLNGAVISCYGNPVNCGIIISTGGAHVPAGCHKRTGDSSNNYYCILK